MPPCCYSLRATTLIHTITAQTNHPQAPAHQAELYCFDNPLMELTAEPFVESATAAINDTLQWAGRPITGSVQLRFTTDLEEALTTFRREQLPVIDLALAHPTDDGHTYRLNVLYPDDAVDAWLDQTLLDPAQTCWLCPVLLQYFPEGAPEHLYVQIQPL